MYRQKFATDFSKYGQISNQQKKKSIAPVPVIEARAHDFGSVIDRYVEEEYASEESVELDLPRFLEFLKTEKLSLKIDHDDAFQRYKMTTYSAPPVSYSLYLG